MHLVNVFAPFSISWQERNFTSVMGNSHACPLTNTNPPAFVALKDDHIHLIDTNVQLIDKIPAKIEPIYEVCILSENIIIIYSTFTSEIIYILDTNTRTFLHKHYDFRSLCNQGACRKVYTTMLRMNCDTVLIHNTDITILNIRTLTKDVFEILHADDKTVHILDEHTFVMYDTDVTITIHDTVTHTRTEIQFFGFEQYLPNHDDYRKQILRVVSGRTLLPIDSNTVCMYNRQFCFKFDLQTLVYELLYECSRKSIESVNVLSHYLIVQVDYYAILFDIDNYYIRKDIGIYCMNYPLAIHENSLYCQTVPTISALDMITGVERVISFQDRGKSFMLDQERMYISKYEKLNVARVYSLVDKQFTQHEESYDRLYPMYRTPKRATRMEILVTHFMDVMFMF